MTDTKEKTQVAAAREANCDIRIWCEECQRSDYTNIGDKYLCTTCGKIMHLDHEVHHEIFPHVSGDKNKIS